MWVDLSCHPSFGEHFGLAMDNVPTVLVISPKKAMWGQYMGAFEAKKIGTYISGVLAGKKRIGSLPGPKGDRKVPAISSEEDCAAAHAACAAIGALMRTLADSSES